MVVVLHCLFISSPKQIMGGEIEFLSLCVVNLKSKLSVTFKALYVLTLLITPPNQ